MSAGCLLSIFSPHTRSIRHAVCFPPATAPSGPLFFWAYVFYLSKYLEFGDTLLIILSKSNQRLTFLHVYHHATVVVIGGGCSGMAGWCFNAVFNASLLALFVDFHGKSYKKRKEAEKKIATKIQ
ncbi:Elongation of very long chain fatty acids protein 6 [Linum perenne]